MTKTHSLLLLLLALCLTACGKFANDREADWCVDSDVLYGPAIAAGIEWGLASENAESGPVNFRYHLHADDCMDADTRIVLSSEDLPEKAAGWAKATWDGQFEIRIRDGEWTKDYDHLRTTILHEMGHFLTGNNHSEDPRDVMYPRNVGVQHLTDADIARLDGVREWH